MIMHSR